MSKRKPPEWQIAAERDIETRDTARKLRETVKALEESDKVREREKAEARRTVVLILAGASKPLTFHEIETISCLSLHTLSHLWRVVSELVETGVVQKVGYHYQLPILDKLARL